MTKKEINKAQQQEGYLVTARKWRPKTYSDVTSQEFITTTLKNAIKNNLVSHAYLFCGPRGVGKTTVARLLAKSLNCLNPQSNGEPCNECDSCNEINNDNRNHPDVFEIDGASNRNIEDVRELKEKVKYAPLRSKYKIFIIDEVHMLTGASFNALLKTLEEPPRYVVFIFATTSPEKVPLTILGRCQKFDFKRLTIDEIQTRLKTIAEKEKVKIDDESLFFISKKGDGSMRDAQGLFDMSAAYCDNDISFDTLKSFFNLVDSDVYFRITELIKSENGSELLAYFDELLNKGYDMQSFLDGLTGHYRNLLVSAATNSAQLIIDSESAKQKYQSNIGIFSEIQIVSSLKLILQTEYTFRYSSNQRTLIEALLIELIKFTKTKELSYLLDELSKIKSGKPTTDNKELSTSVSTDKPQTNIKVKYDNPAKAYEPPTVVEENSRQIIHEKPKVSLVPTGNLDTDWMTIKDQISLERKWVYSIIKDSALAQKDSLSYTIMIDDNKFEVVQSYKEFLTNKLTNYFGENLSITFSRFSDQKAGRKSELADTSTENIPDENYEKIRSILIKDFNAKEIN